MSQNGGLLRLVLLDVEVEGLGRVLGDDDGRVEDRRAAGATRYGDVYSSRDVVDQIVKRERGLADDRVGCSGVYGQQIEVCGLRCVGPAVDAVRKLKRCPSLTSVARSRAGRPTLRACAVVNVNGSIVSR